MIESTVRWQTALQAAAALQPVSRGTLPVKELARRGPFRLYRFPAPELGSLPPVLLVYSLINRPDLLDLAPRRSLVRDLRAAGFPVYLVDWGYPLLADGDLDLEDYVPGFLTQAIRAVETDTGASPLVAGICQGGTLAIMLAALEPELIAALACIGTPVDFHAGEAELARLAHAWPMPGDTVAPGLVSGNRLSAGFTALRPADLLLRRYQPLPAMAEQPVALDEFLRMEAWMYDCPDQPTRVFHRFLRDGYLDNRLVGDAMELAGRTLRLAEIRCPVLNIHATADHLVPPESSQALGGLLDAGTPYRELSLPGGHLGLFLSSKVRQQLVTAVAEHAQNHL